jgi:predicted acylesterase/phospholipase RssA
LARGQPRRSIAATAQEASMNGPAAPPPDRFCDLVMKGGITSGVVYPAAIDRLRRSYRFKSIGGTSAGAIAAAVTAAAEYRRRVDGSEAGFDRLAKLPQELGGPSAVPGTSTLLSLFQPQPATRRLFAVLVHTLNSTSTMRRWGAVLAGFLRAYWEAVAAALVIAFVIGLFSGFVAFVLAALVGTVAFIGLWVYRDVTRHVVANHYGLCTGLTAGSAGPGLTPWLHALIQEAAGRSAGDAPLTFGDLWDAPGFPPPWLEIPAGAKPRSIDLQMFSTNLAHGRPYIFPLAEDADTPSLRTRERLFFRPEELAPLLPSEVLDWMRAHARPYRLEPDRAGQDPDEAKADGLLELPEQRHFPVLLAARMSLSFPLLFSAVPLWAIDHDLPRGERIFRRCWFSDGGISSNFPMHLFDGLVPMWPTFGISLEPKLPRRDNLVFLPQHYREGYGERWNRFDEKGESVGRFGGFLGAIVGTMQNWNDNALSRMPGVRDRVARVRLDDNEGGLNLNMDRAIIERVAGRGAEAADQLVARFADGPGWDEHRLVRLNALLKMIEARAPGVITGLGDRCGHATDYATLVQRATQAAAAGYERPLSAEQAQALQEVIDALRRYMAMVAPNLAKNPFVAVPKPELRVRPPL